MNSVRPLTNVTVMFFPLSFVKTKIVLLHKGWRKGDEWEEARNYFEKAWGGALEKLKEVVVLKG